MFNFTQYEKNEVISALSNMEIPWGNDDELEWGAEDKAYNDTVKELEYIFEELLKERIERFIDNYEIVTGHAEV